MLHVRDTQVCYMWVAIYKACYMCLTQALSPFDILCIYVNKMYDFKVFNAAKVLCHANVICNHNFKVMNHILICIY